MNPTPTKAQFAELVDKTTQALGLAIRDRTSMRVDVYDENAKRGIVLNYGEFSAEMVRFPTEQWEAEAKRYVGEIIRRAIEFPTLEEASPRLFPRLSPNRLLPPDVVAFQLTKHWSVYAAYIPEPTRPDNLCAYTITTRILELWGVKSGDMKGAETLITRLTQFEQANLRQHFSAPGHFKWDEKSAAWGNTGNNWLFDQVAFMQAPRVLKPWPKGGAVMFAPTSDPVGIKPLRKRNDVKHLLAFADWSLKQSNSRPNQNTTTALWTDGRNWCDLEIKPMGAGITLDGTDFNFTAALHMLGATKHDLQWESNDRPAYESN